MNRSQEEINSRETETEYTKEVIRIFIFNCACQFYMLIFSCKLIWQFSSKYIIIFAWFMDLITFVIVMLDRNIGKVLSGVYFVEKVLSISFKITIVIHFEVQEMKLYYIPTAQLLLTIGLFLFQVLKYEIPRRKHIIVFWIQNFHQFNFKNAQLLFQYKSQINISLNFESRLAINLYLVQFQFALSVDLILYYTITILIILCIRLLILILYSM